MTYQDSLEKMFSETQVKDVMTRALVSVDPSTTLNQISKMMEQGSMGSILVKKDGTPSGIITDRDFAIKIAAHGVSMDTPVEKIASFSLITINAKDSIFSLKGSFFSFTDKISSSLPKSEFSLFSKYCWSER